VTAQEAAVKSRGCARASCRIASVITGYSLQDLPDDVEVIVHVEIAVVDAKRPSVDQCVGAAVDHLVVLVPGNRSPPSLVKKWE
jgi:hypothetical protein